jgi:hypothetical protein
MQKFYYYYFWLFCLKLQNLYVDTILGPESSRDSLAFPFSFSVPYEMMPCWDIHVYWLHTDYIIYMNKQPLAHYSLAYNLSASTKSAFNHARCLKASKLCGCTTQPKESSLSWAVWLSGHGHPRSLHPSPMLNVKRDACLDGLQLHSHALRR